MHYRETLGDYEKIPDEEIEEVLRLYLETISTPLSQWLERMLVKYEVEHIIWDQSASPEWQLERFSFLEEVSDFGSLAIYRFVK